MGNFQTNSSQKKKKNLASCFGCIQHDNNEHDCNELHIGDHKPQGKINEKSVEYLSEDEINFFKAASGRNISAIRLYLRRGVNINVLDEDRTSPLHVASRHGSVQIVEELLNWGASPNITDCAGWTPLHVAAFFQRPLICHILLKSEADQDLRNRDGQNALDLVRDQKTQEILQNHWNKQYLKELHQEKAQSSSPVKNNTNTYQFEANVKTLNNDCNNSSHISNNCQLENQELQPQQEVLSQQFIRESTMEGQQQKIQDQKQVLQVSESRNSAAKRTGVNNGSFYQSENQQILSNKSSFISNQQQQQQYLQQQIQLQLCSPKKHKYYLYFKQLKAKYTGQATNVNEEENVQNIQNSDKKFDNIDLQTLYSELDQNLEFNKENCFSRQDMAANPGIGSAQDGDNMIDEYNQAYEENEQKNISQITFNNFVSEQLAQKEFSASGNKFYNANVAAGNRSNTHTPKIRSPSRKNSTTQRNEPATFDAYCKQKIKIKEYLSANQSIPFRLKTVYNTPCDAKKDLDFKMRKKPSRNPSIQFQSNKNQQNSEVNKVASSPCPSMTSLFFLNKQYVSLGTLVKEQPLKQIDSSINNKLLPSSTSSQSSTKLNSANVMASVSQFTATKKIIEIGITLFNYEPLLGLAYLILVNYIKPDIQSVSSFLQAESTECSVAKNKFSIGRLLTETRLKEFNDILHLFMKDFQFQMPFCSAIRFVFQHLVIENNPEKIDVVLHQFSRRYYNNLQQKDQKDLFQNADAVHMLAFAIVMFDIELHQDNSQMLNIDLKTLINEFILNVSGINDGDDFSKEFINNIIENILNQQIIKTIQKSQSEELKMTLLGEFLKKIKNNSTVGINVCLEKKKKQAFNCCLYIVDSTAFLIADDDLQTITDSLLMIQLTGLQIVRKSGKFLIKNKIYKNKITLACFQTNPPNVIIKKKDEITIKVQNTKENDLLENNLKIVMLRKQ